MAQLCLDPRFSAGVARDATGVEERLVRERTWHKGRGLRSRRSGARKSCSAQSLVPIVETALQWAVAENGSCRMQRRKDMLSIENGVGRERKVSVEI
jgi:hypothetical protein